MLGAENEHFPLRAGPPPGPSGKKGRAPVAPGARRRPDECALRTAIDEDKANLPQTRRGTTATTVRVTFDVPLVAGKQRPRVLRSGRAYTPRKTADAQRAIARAYADASVERYGRVVTAPAHVPVRLRIATERPLPPSRPRRVDSEPDTYKPDWDNIGKLTDALNGLAWADDAQVTTVTVMKRPRRRGSRTRTTITVSWDDERSPAPQDGEGSRG